MQNNFKQVITLMMLTGVVSPVLAAPVVSQFNDYRPDKVSSNNSETAEQRRQRILDNNTNLQLRLQEQLTTQSEEVARLNGIVELQTDQINQLMERQRQLLIDVADLKGGTKSPKSSTASNSSAVKTSASPEKIDYNKAVSLMNKGKSTEAIKAFESFIGSYPQSYYSPKSYYLLAVLYYNRKQDTDALKKFAEAIKYKTSPDRPDSLYKMAEIAKRNNKPDAATKYYNLVISEYPNSKSAKSAQAALESL